MSTFAADQLARIEALLAANPGVSQISLPDGQGSVQYVDLMAQRAQLRKEIRASAGKRSRLVRLDMGGGL